MFESTGRSYGRLISGLALLCVFGVSSACSTLNGLVSSLEKDWNSLDGAMDDRRVPLPPRVQDFESGELPAQPLLEEN